MDVLSTIGDELRTLVGYTRICISLRTVARNIVDTNLVVIWKFDQGKQALEYDTINYAIIKRLVRVRMTIRVFKDMEARALETMQTRLNDIVKAPS